MGLLGDFIGNAALTGSNMMARQNEQDARSAEAEKQIRLKEELDAKRAEALAQLKTKMEAERALMLAEQSDKVDAKAAETGADREVTKANERAPAVDRNVMGLIKSQLSPAEMEKYYGVKADKESQKIQDKVEAARSIGAAPELRTSLKDEYKLQLGVERDTENQRISQQKADAATTSAEAAATRAEALLSKIGKTGDGNNDKTALAVIEGTRKDLAEEHSSLTRTMSSEVAAATTEAKKQAVRDRYQPQIDAIAIKRSQLADDYNYMREKIGLPKATESTKNTDASTKNVGKSTPTTSVPPINVLKKNVVTTFENGQSWTLENGKQVRVQ